jgi:hypothetical protein
MTLYLTCSWNLTKEVYDCQRINFGKRWETKEKACLYPSEMISSRLYQFILMASTTIDSEV